MSFGVNDDWLDPPECEVRPNCCLCKHGRCCPESEWCYCIPYDEFFDETDVEECDLFELS